MNTQTHAPAKTATVVLKPRPVRRERDFGIGYGRSSGYGSAKRYTNDWGLTRFRFA